MRIKKNMKNKKLGERWTEWKYYKFEYFSGALFWFCLYRFRYENSFQIGNNFSAIFLIFLQLCLVLSPPPLDCISPLPSPNTKPRNENPAVAPAAAEERAEEVISNPVWYFKMKRGGSKRWVCHSAMFIHNSQSAWIAFHSLCYFALGNFKLIQYWSQLRAKLMARRGKRTFRIYIPAAAYIVFVVLKWQWDQASRSELNNLFLQNIFSC